MSTATKSPLNKTIVTAVRVLVYLGCFAIRLFSITQYESVIHEFDPYFNYRMTLDLLKRTLSDWLSFNDGSWNPDGRSIYWMYPGLMVASALIQGLVDMLFAVEVPIREICVCMGAVMSANATLIAFHFGKELKDDITGLFSAFFIAIVPGYISRSVAGSYDNEALAIFTLILSYYLFIRSIKTESYATGILTGIVFGSMSLSWGGCTFILNLIPLYIVVMTLFTKFYSPGMLRAFIGFYTAAIFSILWIKWQALINGENIALHGVAVLCVILVYFKETRKTVSIETMKSLFRAVIVFASAAIIAVVAIISTSSKFVTFSGRVYSFIDPSYARKHVPIIASVSEHQPTTYMAYFFDMGPLSLFMVAGVLMSIRKPSKVNIFLALYIVTTCWFTAVMVRMMLMLAPAVALLAGLPISSMISLSTNLYKQKGFKNKAASLFVLLAAFHSTYFFTNHCLWAAKDAYSSPSIVLASGRGSSRYIFDDYREMYTWMEYNTPEDAYIGSWWDYGYQSHQMSQRKALVDNNTKSFRAIGRVGRMFSLPEAQSYEIAHYLDADYLFLVFGGKIGYSGDDINKFLWMVQIGDAAFHDSPKSDYVGRAGYTVGPGITPAMYNSMMHRFSYHDFGLANPSKQDHVRNVVVRTNESPIEHYDESFSTRHWMLRSFRVKTPTAFGRWKSIPEMYQ